MNQQLITGIPLPGHSFDLFLGKESRNYFTTFVKLTV